MNLIATHKTVKIIDGKEAQYEKNIVYYAGNAHDGKYIYRMWQLNDRNAYAQ